MTQAQSLTEPGEAPGFVAGAVIGQDTPEGDAERAVVAQGRQQGTTSATAAFVRLDVGKGDSRMVVEGHMDEFPTCPGRVLCAIPGHPMSRALKAPELLDIEMEQVAWLGMFVTHDGGGRFEAGQAVEAGLPEPAGDGALANAALLADLAIRLATAPLLNDLRLDRRRQGMGAGFRARGAIFESGHAFGTKTPQPFVGGSYADTAGMSGFLGSQTAIDHAANKQGSTVRR